MPLREHLRELRNRLLKCGIAIVLGAVAGWFLYPPVFDALMRPLYDIAREHPDRFVKINFGQVASPFNLRLRLSFYLGFLVSSPVWLYQLWAFVAPGLHRNERKWAYIFSSIAAPLFAGGMAVAYWTLPKGIAILISFTPLDIQNLIELPTYLDFVIRTMLVFGVAFLIPLVVVLLNMVGVVPARALGKFRPYIILVIFVFAAVATPSGDPFTMCLLAIPMCLLFFAAEVIARINDKRRGERQEELLAD